MPPSTAPSWKKLVSSVASDAEFMKPATVNEIAAVEQKLGIELPQELRELLVEFDGVSANYGSDIVWSASKIQRQNQEFRKMESFQELYMPFDHLLFFGEDGGGDQFAFAIHADGHIHKLDIYRWEHETDARSWLAGSLEQFFTRKLFK